MCLKIPVVSHPHLHVVLSVSFAYPSAGCVAGSLCGFNLHFPDDEWEWTLFHILISHFLYRNIRVQVVLKNCSPVVNISANYPEMHTLRWYLRSWCQRLTSIGRSVTFSSLLVCRPSLFFPFGENSHLGDAWEAF